MNFDNVKIISFNDEVGNTFAVRDKKDIGIYQTSQTISMRNGDKLDEIACRPEIWGDGAEDLSYMIFEVNAEEIVEANLDEGKLKKLIIPVVEDS